MTDKSGSSLDLEGQQADSFSRFYKQLEKERKKINDGQPMIQFFDRKQFHSVHGDDALFIAQEYMRTMAVVKYLGAKKGTATSNGANQNGIPSVCLSLKQFDDIVRDLLMVRNMKVEIYSSKTGGASGGAWIVTAKATPGNLQELEDTVLAGGDQSGTPVVIAIKIHETQGQRTVGIAFVNTTLRRMGAGDFQDNDQLTNFESALVQLGAKECLIPSGSGSDPIAEKVRDVCRAAGVIVTERKRSDFQKKRSSGADLTAELERLVPNVLQRLHTMDASAANGLDALAALCSYLELMRDTTNEGHYRLDGFDLEMYMRLDAAGARALNLFPQPGDSSPSMCLYGLLNHCKTSPGQRRLMQWIRQPLVDVEAIRKRHDLVEALVEEGTVRQALQSENLRRIPDLDRLAKKIQRRRASLEDVVKLFDLVMRLPTIASSLGDCMDSAYGELLQEAFGDPLRAVIDDFENFRRMVENTIDLTEAAHRQYRIKASFDDELAELQSRREGIMREIDDIVADIGDDLSVTIGKQLKLERNNQLGFFLRLSRKDEKLVRSRGRQFISLETRKDGLRFTTTPLQALSNEFQECNALYEEKQSDLVSKAMDIVATYLPVVEDATHLLADLDVLQSLAQAAVNAPEPYVRPTMHAMGTGDLVLKSARHPCLEVQESVSFIPNDVEMHRTESAFQIITGPNMGGKSTFIRQAGVVVLMAQLGSFVPCASAEIPIVDAILCRVGAGDAQLRGVSTFMAEMLETARILRVATRCSLVIIDELGRGTSTYDGFGLAWAISEHISMQIKPFCLFATHYHELTTLAEQVGSVVNKHVTAHTADNTLTMLYRVEDGPCDQSFGIHVAEMAKFPDSVVQLAKRKAALLEMFDTQADEDDEVERALKRSRTEEGNASFDVADRLLREFSETDPKTFNNPKDLEAWASTFRSRMSDAVHGNPFLEQLLGAAPQ